MMLYDELLEPYRTKRNSSLQLYLTAVSLSTTTNHATRNKCNQKIIE